MDCQGIANDAPSQDSLLAHFGDRGRQDRRVASYNVRAFDGLVPEVATQVVDRPESDLAPDDVAEFELELSDGEQARCAAGLELDEQIDVTVGPERPYGGGAEESKNANAAGREERAKWLVVDGDSSARSTAEVSQVGGESSEDIAGRRAKT